MNTSDVQSDPSFNPRPEKRIVLTVHDAKIGIGRELGDSFAGLKLRLSAQGEHSVDEGWALWQLDGSGNAHLLNGSMHQLPYGTINWVVRPEAYRDGKARLYASRSQTDPARVSEFVDVKIPPMPRPEEVSARDGARKVIFTGKSVPLTNVRATLGDREVTGSSGNGPFQLVMDGVPNGTHAYKVVAVGLGDAADSTVVEGKVVLDTPAVQMVLLYPEAGRRIKRIEKVTGTAAQHTKVRVTLAGGTPVEVDVNSSGHWEVPQIQAGKPGRGILEVESLGTGEVLYREVEVEHFSDITVTHVVGGLLVDETGVISRRGFIVAGTGEAGNWIEVASGGQKDFVPLTSVGEDGRWEYRHLDEKTQPVFRPGTLYLRVSGDILEHMETMQKQGPIVLSPRPGDLTGETVRVSGVSAAPVEIIMEDGKTVRATPDMKNNYRWETQLGPLTPGAHTITVRNSPSEREKVEVSFFVNEPQ